MNILFKEKEVANVHEFDVYAANGGFDALKKSLSMTPERSH
jgi:hypothetical protein